jgi:hypothetical protein
MIQDCIRWLLNNKKYNNHIIYVHNLSGFDGVFLLKNIAKYRDKASLILKDNQIISITLRKEYFAFSSKHQNGLLKTNSIKFHDSLLLLPASLNKLAESFGTESKKDFDINRLNSVTSYTLRDPLFKNELLEYNKKDCKVLFDILSIFADQIYSLFKLNITSYPTLSSLAFNIYRSNFMDKVFKIPITSLELYDKLKP